MVVCRNRGEESLNKKIRIIRETVWKRKIEVEKIKYKDGVIKPWKQIGEGVFGGERWEGAQRWCQYEAVNTGPHLILQLSVVIKWEKSRKPPSIQTLSLLLCQDQRIEHYCICNTAQLLKSSPLVFSCFVCCHSCYFARFQAVQTFSKRTNLPFNL